MICLSVLTGSKPTVANTVLDDEPSIDRYS
jgi:hypothetical protein